MKTDVFQNQKETDQTAGRNAAAGEDCISPDPGWLDDPEIFRVGVLPAHSDHEFLADPREKVSSLYQSLNGKWEFHYSRNPAERPADFYKTDFDCSGFDEIQVPCHIEMAGYDKIHYINTMYPWEGHQYKRPKGSLDGKAHWQGAFSEADYNPVGSYRKKFDLEEGLRGKRVSVCFEGVEQAIYLWLNGHFLGYAEDSFTPSEFDLTPYLKEKGNLLAAEVYKRSSAAFLEDQDFFRFFGIFRNVTLKAKPWLHVEDLWARPRLEEDGTGTLELEIRISQEAGIDEEAKRAEVQLADSAGSVLLTHTLLLSGEKKDCGTESVFICRMEPRKIGAVTPWEHGNPCLYQLTVTLYDGENQVVEVVPCPIGFRRIEIKNKVIYLNGKRLILNGVNRHEWSAEGGRCIGLAEMEADLACFKRNNINAVRTCHYPDQIPWYGLCDQAGIYVMSETNLETHGSWQKCAGTETSWNVPGSLPQWQAVVLDRASNHFETLKNHPSILFWSLGNESYAGDDIAAMHRFFKEKDDSRLVHYEGVFQNRSYEDRISDVESRMYASPEDIRAYLENQPKKPFLLCEYMHDMGNSLGGMDSYIRLLDEYEMYQGGFIWDYIDQAILTEDEVTGRRVLRYGGDFDDRPADYDFSGNGIVFADRSEKPAMQEVRYYYGLHK